MMLFFFFYLLLFQSWYILAKTLAEDEAWKFVKENDIDMVAINPAMVIGPLLQPTLNTSGAVILNLINGMDFYIKRKQTKSLELALLVGSAQLLFEGTDPYDMLLVNLFFP